MLQEVDGVGRQPVRMRGGVGGERLDEQGDAVAGEAVRDDQQAGVRAVVLEALQGEAEEIVAIARDQAPAVLGRAGELVVVGQPAGADLVDTDGINAAPAKPFGRGGAQIFVEVILHGRGATSAGYCAASRSGVQFAFRATCCSISAG